MDRRILAVVAVLAMGGALVLSWVMMPGVDDVPATTASPEPAKQVARAPAPSAPVATRPAPQRMDAAPEPRELKQWERSEGVVGGQPHIKPQAEQVESDPEVVREYRCRALGQQADIIDKLMVIASGSAVDAEQKATMVSRVAELSTTVLDSGESLWNGELSCDGITDVNLGPAADFLAQARDELDLSEDGVAQINQALAALDTVEWPEEVQQ